MCHGGVLISTLLIVVDTVLDYAFAMIRFLLLALCCTPLMAAEERYRIVHPDGTVEYTDQPTEGAEAVTLPEITTYPPPAPNTTPSPTAPANGEKAATSQQQQQGYSLFSISSPADQQTVWFDEAGMNVSLQVQPGLAEGDAVIIRIDGEVVATGNVTTYTIKNVYRGTHTLSAVITDEQGTMLKKAGPITFTMRQHSIQHPKPE